MPEWIVHHTDDFLEVSDFVFLAFILFFKIQTPGGGYYQRFCLCDTSVYTPDDLLYSGGLVDYSCRNGTTDGPLTTIQGKLRCYCTLQLLIVVSI